MTPQEVAEALVIARVVIQTENLTFREGLRIEQMTALLQTKETAVDPQAFYDLATEPPAELLDDFPWLKAILPEGASLEGFLYPDTYSIVVSANGGNVAVTDADALIRVLLNRFHEKVGDARMAVPEDRGLSFYEIVTLASIVEHEAIVDKERALIAGAYQNRLDGIKGVAKILNADPTVTYAKDTIELAKLPFEQWQSVLLLEGPAEPARRLRRPEGAPGLPDLPDRRPHPRSDLDAEPGVDRRRARAGPVRRLPVLRGDPGLAGARVREDACRAQRQPPQVRLPLTPATRKGTPA